MSDRRRDRRLENVLRRARTDVGFALAKPWPFLVVAIVVTGLAVVLAPEARTRHEAEALWPVFLGLLAVTVTIIAAYAGVARTREASMRPYALVIAAVGCIAAILGLLRLPLDLFKFTFALAVGALVHAVLAVVALLL